MVYFSELFIYCRDNLVYNGEVVSFALVPRIVTCPGGDLFTVKVRTFEVLGLWDLNCIIRGNYAMTNGFYLY